MEVVASLSQGRTAASQCGLFTYKSVPVIFEPPCICKLTKSVFVGLVLIVVLDCLFLPENNLLHVQLELEAPLSLSFCCNSYIDIDIGRPAYQCEINRELISVGHHKRSRRNMLRSLEFETTSCAFVQGIIKI